VIPPVIAVVDFETTRPPRGGVAEPWQVGVILLRDGVPDPESKWFSYLRVSGRARFSGVLPTRAELEKMEHSPAFADIFPELMTRYLHHPLAAHHAAVERNILRRAAPLHDFSGWLDTLELAKRHLPGLPSYALADLCALLGLEEHLRVLCPGLAPHNALYDACACGLLLHYLQTGYSAISLHMREAHEPEML
jgi:DNA polymerase III epsilon subunit-like protein